MSARSCARMCIRGRTRSPSCSRVEIGFRSEDQEVVLGTGGYIVKPRNQVHAMWNAGSVPARMIEIISPAGFEGFFRGFADLNDAGPIDLAAVAALAADFGLPYADPDWLPEIIERYGLTPPPPRPSSGT